jgi:hypothetical protein
MSASNIYKTEKFTLVFVHDSYQIIIMDYINELQSEFCKST